MATKKKKTDAPEAPPEMSITAVPVREVSLLDLSAIGVSIPGLPKVIGHPERARKVSLGREASREVLQLRRVVRLDIYGEPPGWLGELRHLRTIVWGGSLEVLPAQLLALPRLRSLHLDRTQLRSLDGAEKLRSLATITISNTPLHADADACAKAVAAIPGAKLSGWSIEVKRPAAPAPRDKATLAKSLRADELDDDSDLRGVDLAGETFEDAYVTHDLREAKLAGTTWRRCDFDRATLAGADLTGAVFEDCYFSGTYATHGNLSGAQATSSRFLRCGGTLEMTGANLEGAKFALEDDTHLTWDMANAKNIELRLAFAGEKQHSVSMKGADVTGAKMVFDVSASRRRAIEAKPTMRPKWNTTHAEGAKTDPSTTIYYAAFK